MNKNLLKMIAAPAALVLSVSIATVVLADDTELYSATYQAGATGKPKVLILFDDSGSMNEVVEGVKPDYDPNGTYVQKVPANRIYWNTSGSPPNVDNTTGAKQWFPASKNSCASSWNPLSEQGMFSTPAKRWQEASGSWQRVCTRKDNRNRCTRYEDQWSGTAAGWLDLSSSVNSPYTVDCFADAESQTPNAANASPIGNGYPQTLPAPDTSNANAYTADANNSNVSWGGTRSFYTSHYMNWYYDNSIIPADKDYLQIAQEVIENIVSANPTLDFGLGVFNNNDSGNDNGGRIVKRIIKNMTESDRNSLVDALWTLDHDGNTPLCETAWEAYLYMTGGQRKWGISGDSRDLPLRDILAESGLNYISPLEACTNTYIIYMTDGLPTSDTGADTDVKKLTGKSCRTYSSIDPVYGDTVSFTNCMAPLMEYMADMDPDKDLGNGKQNVLTATIGFNVDPRADAFLIDSTTMTKSDGSPAYYYAESADELTASFTDIILGILTSEATFTSPAVAVDSFTRTESREDVFYAMFEPRAIADWWGNIKKLKLKIINGETVIVDAGENAAFDDSGEISDSARTYWSTTTDGSKVSAGGVGALLQARTLSTRNILTNTGEDGELEAFTAANVDPEAYGMDTDAELYAFWQVADEADFENSIDWGWGYDVDDSDRDDNRSETRQWIMADILHSKPLVINYGELGNFTKEEPDVRIVAGTNNGMLHMFDNSDGQEDWAFYPKELGPVLTKRRKNIRGSNNIYGIDAPATAYTIDLNRDGTLDHTAGDKVYLYFGLRRGGNLLYAMDVSNPEEPSFMWSVSPDVQGFRELGQTWSVPTVTKIPGYKDNDGKPKPVLIFGGGYDEVNDSHATYADTDADTMGRGIFIVDAVTGALVWSITPAADSLTNMQELGLVHAIPADVKTVDSNGDGLTDRIYAADVGGNVWRVDMPGNARPDARQDKWLITHMLDANNNTQTTDRRFFSAPDIVRTTWNGRPIDAILIGSGDRTNPIAKDYPNNPTVDDQFYMIRDLHTKPYVAPLDPKSCEDDNPNPDFRCYLPLKPWETDDFYDITANYLEIGTPEQKAAALAGLTAAHGWRLDLTGDGEKSMSSSVTIAGKVLFTTFSPVVDLVGCGFSAGTARLYAINLFTGVAAIDCDDDGDKDRFCLPPGGNLLETPTLFFPGKKDDDDDDEDACEGDCEDPGVKIILPQFIGDTGESMPGPYGSYWNRGDYP